MGHAVSGAYIQSLHAPRVQKHVGQAPKRYEWRCLQRALDQMTRQRAGDPTFYRWPICGWLAYIYPKQGTPCAAFHVELRIQSIR